MLLLNGKVAENFPKLTVSELTLERVFKMGMITKQELTIAKLCNGSNSPLQLSRKMELHMSRYPTVFASLSKFGHHPI